MAKINFSIEADSIEEFKKIIAELAGTGAPAVKPDCSNQCDAKAAEVTVEQTEEVQEVETTKRKRRTKQEIEAEKQASAEPVVIEVHEGEVEVLPPLTAAPVVAEVSSAVPNFNFQMPGVSSNPSAEPLVAAPTIGGLAAPAPLPTDLLSALGVNVSL
jgi:hypothetical protein